MFRDFSPVHSQLSSTAHRWGCLSITDTFTSFRFSLTPYISWAHTVTHPQATGPRHHCIFPGPFVFFLLISQLGPAFLSSLPCVIYAPSLKNLIVKELIFQVMLSTKLFRKRTGPPEEEVLPGVIGKHWSHQIDTSSFVKDVFCCNKH